MAQAPSQWLLPSLMFTDSSPELPMQESSDLGFSAVIPSERFARGALSSLSPLQVPRCAVPAHQVCHPLDFLVRSTAPDNRPNLTIGAIPQVADDYRRVESQRA